MFANDFDSAPQWFQIPATEKPRFFAGRSGSIREPDERYAEEAEVGAHESDALIEANAGVRGVELPGGMLRIANGDPAAADEVNVAGEAFDFRSLEIERILRNQN